MGTSGVYDGGSGTHYSDSGICDGDGEGLLVAGVMFPNLLADLRAEWRGSKVTPFHCIQKISDHFIYRELYHDNLCTACTVKPSFTPWLKACP